MTAGSRWPPLVLDANAFGFGPVSMLQELAERGFKLRVSELAFYERLARQFRDHARGRCSATEACDRFVRRLVAVTPYLDTTTPIALGGANLTRRIEATASGLGPDEKAENHAAILIDNWRAIAARGLAQPRWLHLSTTAEAIVSGMRQRFRDLCRPSRAPNESEDSRESDPQLTGVNWESVPKEHRRRVVQLCMKPHWDLSDAATERLDGQLCANGYRLYTALYRSREPSWNDGSDVSLPIHIGEGCVLLTDERRLVDLVDQSGTYQAPWVRRPDELDDSPPQGPPWGEGAVLAAESFRRRSR